MPQQTEKTLTEIRDLLSGQSGLSTSTRANWRYAAAAGGITDDSAVTVAPAVVGRRNYVSAVQLVNAHGSVATEVIITSGGMILHRFHCRATGGGWAGEFPRPLEGELGNTIEVQAVTTGAQVYFNAQGYAE